MRSWENGPSVWSRNIMNSNRLVAIRTEAALEWAVHSRYATNYLEVLGHDQEVRATRSRPALFACTARG
jgi:hypothetical protein